MLVLIGTTYDNKNNEKISKLIERVNPYRVLCEFLWDRDLTKLDKTRKQLSDCANDEPCDPRVNRWVYKLALRMLPLVKFIGIGVDFKKKTDHALEYLKSPKFFRSNEMAVAKSVVDEVGSLAFSKLIVCVVDDKLLRNKKDGDFYDKKIGWSILMKRLSNEKVPFVVLRKKQISDMELTEITKLSKIWDAERYM